MNTNISRLSQARFPLSPFACAASYLRKLGLAPIPIAPGEKKPLISGFQHWRYSPSEETLADLASKYPDAQIGVLCGLSKLVVVDLDDAALLDYGLERFGRTPLIIKTRRGYHLYYRAYGGERARNLRSQGLAIDVKAGAGFVMVPPSLNSAGEPLTFWTGSWQYLDRLPQFRDSHTPQTPKNTKSQVLGSSLGKTAPASLLLPPSGAAGDDITLVLRRNTDKSLKNRVFQTNIEALHGVSPVSRETHASLTPVSRQSHASLTSRAENVVPLRKNAEGERNNALFQFLRRRPLTTLGALERDALWYNNACHELPEEPDKALATARSVWRYRSQWQTYFTGALAQLAPGAIVILPEIDDAIAEAAGQRYPQEIATYMRLQRAHAARGLRGEVFSISPPAMAAADTVPGLKRWAIERARDDLLTAGVLTRIQEFSAAQRQGALYQFVTPAPASALAAIAQLSAPAAPIQQPAPATEPRSWEAAGVSKATFYRRRQNSIDRGK